MRRRSLAIVGAAALVACGPQLGDDVTLGESIKCAEPTTGFDRLSEVGAERGIDLELSLAQEQGHGCNYIPGAVVASDLDADGDVDLLFGNVEGFPFVFANDGAGSFEAAAEDATVGEALAALDRAWLAVGAVDLNGDGLPELILSGDGIAVVLDNLGGLEFDLPRVAWDEGGWPRSCFQTMDWGDADGDGDLDLALAGLDVVPFEGFVPEEIVPDVGAAERVLLQEDDGSFSLALDLAPAGHDPWLAVMIQFTDRDGDGDADLLVGTDRGVPVGVPSRFYRNDGPDGDGTPRLVDDALEIGAAAWAQAMGLDVRDLDDDGLPDYCMTDIDDSITCLVSGSGSYYVAGKAQGLVSDAESNPEWEAGFTWSSWSFQFVDLDSDGLVDAAATAGEPADFGSVLNARYDQPQPNTLWQGLEDGAFDVRGAELGFDDPAHHYGMALADLAGDGYPELVVAPAEGRPLVWDNPCGDHGWLEVDLVGPPGNRDGFGAHVTVETRGQPELQELLGLRTLGQSAPVLHFGLGESPRADRLEVRWPDGHISAATRVPARRVVTVTHPDAN